MRDGSGQGRFSGEGEGQALAGDTTPLPKSQERNNQTDEDRRESSSQSLADDDAILVRAGAPRELQRLLLPTGTVRLLHPPPPEDEKQMIEDQNIYISKIARGLKLCRSFIFMNRNSSRSQKGLSGANWYTDNFCIFCRNPDQH